MQRCQHWISPLRVHSLMSTGSGDWSIRLSVVIWIVWGISRNYCYRWSWRYCACEWKLGQAVGEQVSTWTSRNSWRWWHPKARSQCPWWEWKCPTDSRERWETRCEIAGRKSSAWLAGMRERTSRSHIQSPYYHRMQKIFHNIRQGCGQRKPCAWFGRWGTRCHSHWTHSERSA